MPCIFSWKGSIREEQISSTPMISTDFFPTILSMAGITVGKDNPVDGIDLTSVLKGGTISRRQLTWFMPHYVQAGEGLTSSAAIRAGDYKLVKLFEGGGTLHDLRKDIGEAKDLSQKEPALFKKLDDALMSELRRQNAHFPIVNKNFGPKESDHSKGPVKKETHRKSPPSRVGEKTSGNS